MARDVEFNVTASDRSGNALASAERGFAASQAKMVREHERAAAKMAATTDRHLKQSQEKARKQNARMHADWLKSAGTIAGAGSRVGVLFGEDFAKGLSRAAPAAGPVLAGVAVAAAPIIGATVAAAIIGGAGVGGVIGGIMLVKDDPRVKVAGTSLATNLLADLRGRAEVFVQPVLDAIDTIDERFQQSGGDIGRILDNAARFVAPLVDGVTRFVQYVTRGVARLTDGAQPVIDTIGRGLEAMGVAVDRLFTNLADDGVSAASALEGVFGALVVTIDAVGVALNALTEAYGFLAKLGAFGQKAALEYGRLEANARIAAESVQESGTAVNEMTGAGNAAAEAIGKLVESIGDLTGANRDLYGSQISAAEAVAEATKIIDKNGEALSLNSERGRENRKALDQVAASLAAEYEAFVKVNGAGTEADAVAKRNRASFVKLAEDAGYAADGARALADRLLGIPAKRTPKVMLDDLTKKPIQTIMERLAAIRNRTVTVNVAVRQSGDAAALRKQNIKAYSAARSFAAAGPEPGGSRVGGPTPISLESTLNVLLDGRPFREMTSTAIDASERRQAWRRKVGVR